MMTRRNAMFHRCRLLPLLVAGGLVVVAGLGCRSRTQPAGGAHTPKAQDARKRAETAAVDAATAGARALKDVNATVRGGGKFGPVIVAIGLPPAGKVSTPAAPPKPAEPAAPITPPVPAAPQAIVDAYASAKSATGQVVFKESVSSGAAFSTEAEASSEALKQAQTRIHQQFGYEPTLETVRTEYARRKVVRRVDEQERRDLATAGRPDAQVIVEYDIVVTEHQIREMRTRDRLAAALRMLGIAAAVALAGFLFLRLDEWSKGYLTSWLAVAAAALAGGAVVAVLLV